jgi:diacylglycerol kinase family enzyme
VITQEPLDMTLDGEIRGHTPIDIRVAPHPLRVLLPRDAEALAIGGTELRAG